VASCIPGIFLSPRSSAVLGGNLNGARIIGGEPGLDVGLDGPRLENPNPNPVPFETEEGLPGRSDGE